MMPSGYAFVLDFRGSGRFGDPKGIRCHLARELLGRSHQEKQQAKSTSTEHV